MRALHHIEKKIIRRLVKSAASEAVLAADTGLADDQVRRGVEWLRLKGLADVSESRTVTVSLGPNGRRALREGLPERRLLRLIKDGGCSLPKLKKSLGDDLNTALGIAARSGWVRVGGGTVELARQPGAVPEEELLDAVGTREVPLDSLDRTAYASLKKRPDFVLSSHTTTRNVSLTTAGRNVDLGGTGLDVEAAVPRRFVARTHPLKDVISEIREIFVSLGFSEISGDLAQPGFWNFDALFTPQDHPARDMHDTFYLDGIKARSPATKRQVESVARAHSSGWRYDWNRSESRRMVLRTHTTCVTIRHLAEHRPESAMVFSLGRVFRNEKPSYKHLVEFHQVEGVVSGKNATLRDLMGIQKEFYRKMGIDKVRFWPTFFPYTEPSLQTMVYNERLGKWVELFGMGIFRPEVIDPLGIPGPVLAWGGGIERIAMLRYELDDVREFYNSRLEWLREVTCR